MPKVSPIQGNFTAGELDPLVHGRAGDLDRYKQGLALCENYVPLIQGGITRRPGTFFVEEVKTSAKKTRLIPFKFSATDAFMLEVGDLYIRFYSQRGQVLEVTGAAAYEVTTTYTEDEIFDINFTQSADVMYLVHPNHRPRKLYRYAANQWSLDDILFYSGPYNSSALDATFTSSATAIGAATLTGVPGFGYFVGSTSNNAGRYQITMTSTVTPYVASFTKVRITQFAGTVAFTGDWDLEYIGGNSFIILGSTYAAGYTYPTDIATVYPQIFTAADVGRYMQIAQSGAARKRVQISSFTNSHSVGINILETLGSTTGNLGYFQAFWTNDGPAAVSFFEDRLFYMKGQTLYGSETGDYDSFELTTGGTVTASNAVSFTLNSNDVNEGRWLFSDEKALLAGTLANEWVVKSASSQEAISPTSISAKQTSSIGSSECYPVQAGKAVLFVQKSGRKIREFHYFYDVDGFRATDLSVLATHITSSGLKQLAYQKDPHQIVWGVKEDGGLVALTYDRDIDNLRAGWHKHSLGGTNDVESVAVIPSPDGTTDEVWLVVKRTINGSTKRYIEYLGGFFTDETEQHEAYFLDCGLTYDDPKTITAITAASPPVVTSVAHGFVNGDTVIFRDVEGMTELNSNTYTVANKTNDTFELSGVVGASYTAYTSGGEVRKKVQTISGLSHLNGESVSIFADGAVQTNKTVSGGSITLDSKAGTVHVGFHSSARGQLLRIDAGAADGTSIGKTRRINRVGFMFHRSLNLKIGPSFDELTRLQFRTPSVPMGQPPSLYSGIMVENFDANYDFENQVSWEQDQPLPSTILAIMPSMTTQDR